MKTTVSFGLRETTTERQIVLGFRPVGETVAQPPRGKEIQCFAPAGAELELLGEQ